MKSNSLSYESLSMTNVEGIDINGFPKIVTDDNIYIPAAAEEVLLKPSKLSLNGQYQRTMIGRVGVVFLVEVCEVRGVPLSW